MGKERISRRKITSGDITRVIELYAAGRTYSEISQTLGIARGSVSNALRYGEIEPDRRRTEPLPKKTVVEHVCGKCRRNIPITGARFCPFCGSDVRSERVKCAEALTYGLGIVSDLPIPAEQKDRFMNALRDAVRLLTADE